MPGARAQSDRFPEDRMPRDGKNRSAGADSEGRAIVPEVLVIEAVEPNTHTPAWQSWEPYLVEQCGYMFVYFDRLNRFYVRRENRELAARLRFRPICLTGFSCM